MHETRTFIAVVSAFAAFLGVASILVHPTSANEVVGPTQMTEDTAVIATTTVQNKDVVITLPVYRVSAAPVVVAETEVEPTEELVEEVMVAPVLAETAVETVPVTKKVEDTSAPVVGTFAQQVITLLHTYTNAARTEHGLAPLAYDAALAKSAQSYSEAMIEKQFLSHTDPSGCDFTCRFAKSRYVAFWWGENIAQWKATYDPTALEVAEYMMREWLKSDGHRENILSEHYTAEGIGIDQADGEIIVTVHFAQPE